MPRKVIHSSRRSDREPPERKCGTCDVMPRHPQRRGVSGLAKSSNEETASCHSRPGSPIRAGTRNNGPCRRAGALGGGNPSSENYTSNPIALVKEDPAQVASALLTIHHLYMRLFLARVDHWCRPPLEYSLSLEIWKNTSIPLLPDGSYSKCNMYHPTAHTANGSKVVVSCNEWEYDLSLLCRSRARSLTASAGSLSSAPAFIVAVVSAGASVVSKSFLAFVVSCMLLAASLSIVRLLIIIVLFENSGEGYRDFYVCLAKFGSIYGIVIVAVTDYYATQRIVLNLTVFVIAVLLTSVYCFVDESVTWLLAYRDYDRANTSSTRLRCATGGRTPVTASSAATRPATAHQPARHKLATFVATHELRCRTAILSWILLCLFLVQYGMLATGEKVDTLRGNVALVLIRCCSFPLAWKLLRDFPRKSALSMALPMTCCLLCLLSVSKFKGAASVTWILEEVVIASIVGEAIVVYVFTLELFPTVIRGMGTSIVYFFGQCAVMLAPIS
ncbi:solute carrier family 22 member 5 [Dermacentor silvarum]|uniref:solute carrier family 22 member 5 n=1 Tax=Dermacentor silvarum TaxID=543639 RepID=UPI0018994DC4|nr:solute carrier family 22 member 5 [Dermacentor silvarum]